MEAIVYYLQIFLLCARQNGMGRNRLMSKHLLRAMLTLWFPFLGSFKQAVRQVMRLGKKLWFRPFSSEPKNEWILAFDFGSILNANVLISKVSVYFVLSP